ncbi:hypothetical protein GQ457_02G001410 [Hibiscus cannabinus]
MAESDGVGLNKLQFTIRMPMSFGLTPIFMKSWSAAPNTTASASAQASSMHRLNIVVASLAPPTVTVSFVQLFKRKL